MIIYLIGFMGCGKSTLGKPLARKLLLDFVDMDDYIEETEGMKVSEIFAQKGEPYFRKVERMALEVLSLGSDIVIATGGGVASGEGNMEYMNNNGTTIYLKMNGATLLSRLKNSKNVRPVFNGKSLEEMSEIIDRMLLEREPYYERASCIINGMNINVMDIVTVVKEIR